MAPGPTTLYDMAAELLGAAGDALGTTLAGAPGRQYVSIGPPAYDCEQLTTHWAQADKDNWSPNQAPGDTYHRLRGGSVNLVGFTVTVLRCVSVPSTTGKPPSPAALDADALVEATDAWVLWNYLQSRLKDKTLWQRYPCGEIRLSPMLPIAPEGAFGGTALLLVTSVYGFEMAAV